MPLCISMRIPDAMTYLLDLLCLLTEEHVDDGAGIAPGIRDVMEHSWHCIIVKRSIIIFIHNRDVVDGGTRLPTHFI